MNDEEIREEANSSPTNRGFKIAIVVLVIAVFVGFGWALSSHHNVEQLAASRDQLQASLGQTRSQVDALTAKLNAWAAATAAQTSQQTTPQQAAPERTEKVKKVVRRTHRATRRHVVRRRPAEDPRWKQVQSELAVQKQQLAAQQHQLQQTQANLDRARTDLQDSLDSARDDLNGSIAKNHDQLVALEKRGMRNYYEFDLDKSKHFHHEGPVSISLRKTNAKHDYCRLVLLVNDAELTRKHVNLYEPVTFRPEGYSGPVEIVINNIERNHVHGYVSEPKYKPSELAATPATQPAGTRTNASTSATASAGTTSVTPTSTVDASLQHRAQQ
jgi:prefoldin subunit 5